MELEKYFEGTPVDVDLVDLMLRRIALEYQKYGKNSVQKRIDQEDDNVNCPFDLAWKKITLYRLFEKRERHLLDAIYYLYEQIIFDRKEKYGR